MSAFPLSTKLAGPMIVILCLVLAVDCSDILPPDTPRNLTATALSQHHIQLNWTCYDEEYCDFWTGCYSPVVNYFVYRDGERVADVGDPEYNDLNLDPDTIYCYRVSSYWYDNLFDLFFVQESHKSQEACAWTYPLNAITGTVTFGGEGFEGARVELFRSLGFPALWKTTTTKPDGGYAFNELENNPWMVAPSLPGYLFSPEQREFTLTNEDASGIDFEAFTQP